MPDGGTVAVNTAALPPQLGVTYANAITGLTVTPADGTAQAGTPTSFEARATDGTNSVVAPVAQKLAISPSTAGTGADCTDTTCVATKAGTYTVVASYAGFTALTTLTVEPAGPASIELTPDDTSSAAGTGVPFTVHASDAYGNALPDQSENSTVVTKLLEGGPSLTCPDAVCAPTTAGLYKVNATLPGPDGSTLSDLVTLDVTPGPLAELTISPQDASTNAGQAVGYHVVGSDAYGNLRPEQGATYTYAPVEGGDKVVCSTNACGPTKAGYYTVTASAPGADGAVTAATTLSVVPAGVAALTITPEDEKVAAGSPVHYAVGGVDGHPFTRPDQTASSSVTAVPAAGGDPVACPEGVCTLTTAGTYTVSAAAPDTAGDATTLVVVPAVLHEINLSPSQSTTTAGVAAPYGVTGTDEYGNSRGDLTGKSFLTIRPLGAHGSEEDCLRALCGAEQVGDYVITAYGPMSGETDPVTATAALTVVPAALASLTLSPDVASTEAGEPVSYTATGADRFGNDPRRPDGGQQHHPGHRRRRPRRVPGWHLHPGCRGHLPGARHPGRDPVTPPAFTSSRRPPRSRWRRSMTRSTATRCRSAPASTRTAGTRRVRCG